MATFLETYLGDSGVLGRGDRVAIAAGILSELCLSLSFDIAIGLSLWLDFLLPVLSLELAEIAVDLRLTGDTCSSLKGGEAG
jgi:hypothetical protein